jgi:hypothetical protein
VPFDAGWFSELRGLSEDHLRDTRAQGIAGFVPHVGELCGAGHLSARFLDDTTAFVHAMDRTRYRFDRYFRAYKRHVVNFPKGRAFRKQWNIGCTAGDHPEDDYVRIGLGFRLSGHEDASGVEDYLEFRRDVGSRPAAFNSTFQSLGNYHEFADWEDGDRDESGNYVGDLSELVIRDEPPLEGWRFFGRQLSMDDPQERAVVGSFDRLRDTSVEVFEAIRSAGFGM